ncbi:hypothetical protein BDR26DRAFT_919375 [Obelidium mucronatum]|nr:hypothetical protein BDR26DRAFT_919375 [Obelidium mucronatum]
MWTGGLALAQLYALSQSESRPLQEDIDSGALVSKQFKTGIDGEGGGGGVGIGHLPRELLDQICAYLPLESVKVAGLTSKHVFGCALFGSLPFARRHLDLKGYEASFVPRFNNQQLFDSLPLTYKAVLHEHMFVTRLVWKMNNCIVSEAQATAIVHLLTDAQAFPGFDIHVNADIVFRWCAKLGFLGLMKQLEQSQTHGELAASALADAVQWAATNGDVAMGAWLLGFARTDPGADHDYALRLATTLGHGGFVALLLADGRVDPAADANNAVRAAAALGHAAIVGALLADPRVDPAAAHSNALWAAAEAGHASVVALLLADARADPAAAENHALRMAAANGHAEVVALLLRHAAVDPNAMGGAALAAAAARDHADVLKMLCTDPRVDAVTRAQFTKTAWNIGSWFS